MKLLMVLLFVIYLKVHSLCMFVIYITCLNPIIEYDLYIVSLGSAGYANGQVAARVLSSQHNSKFAMKNMDVGGGTIGVEQQYQDMNNVNGGGVMIVGSHQNTLLLSRKVSK